ncbi:MAG: hypothetical protein VKK59_00535 [Vampirovibrionales bacterium]|nr:hypothetical protein [Vampirovibrionales bacterium]
MSFCNPGGVYSKWYTPYSAPNIPGNSTTWTNYGHDSDNCRRQSRFYNDRKVNYFANAAPEQWLNRMPGVKGPQSDALKTTQEVFQIAGEDKWIDRNEALGLLRRSRKAANELNRIGNTNQANLLNQYGNVFEAINDMYTGRRAFNSDYIKQTAESIGSVMSDSNLNQLG